MKRLTRNVAMAALLAIGCAGVSTSASLAPGTPVAQYRTYNWFKSPSGKPETLAEQEMRAALEASLAQKGLTVATTSPPDFLVAYHATTQEKVNVTPAYGYGYGYPYRYGYRWAGFPDATTYTQGTLIVDFIDPRTNQVFWRGTAQGVAEHPENPDPKRIDKAVAKLIDQYPLQMASAPRQTM